MQHPAEELVALSRDRDTGWKEPTGRRLLTKCRWVYFVNPDDRLCSGTWTILTNAMSYIWTVKTLAYKRRSGSLSYWTLIGVPPDRSDSSYPGEVREWGKLGKSPHDFPLLWAGPAKNPLSSEQKSQAKHHRPMTPLVSKPNLKDTRGLKFYAMTIKCHRTQMWKWIKGRRDCLSPSLAVYTHCRY
jgi:hypothetical protein